MVGGSPGHCPEPVSSRGVSSSNAPALMLTPPDPLPCPDLRGAFREPHPQAVCAGGPIVDGSPIPMSFSSHVGSTVPALTVWPHLGSASSGQEARTLPTGLGDPLPPRVLASEAALAPSSLGAGRVCAVRLEGDFGCCWSPGWVGRGRGRGARHLCLCPPCVACLPALQPSVRPGRQQVAAVSLTRVWARLSSSPVSLLQNWTGR